MRARRIRHCKGREMHPGVACHRRFHLGNERRVGGLEQHLDIAVCKHCGDIARSREPRRPAGGIGIDLNGNRRRRKAQARQCARRRVHIGHEMRHVIEENLLSHGELAVSRCFAHWALSIRSCARRRSAARSTLLVDASGSSSTNQTKRGCA